MMPFLLAYWRYIAVVAVIGIYTAFIWHEGGRSPRAELAAFKAQTEALGNVAKAHVKQVEVKQKEVVKNVSRETKSAIAASDAFYRSLLVKPRPGSLPGIAGTSQGVIIPAAPASPDPGACSPADGSADAITIIELQQFYNGLRQAQQ